MNILMKKLASHNLIESKSKERGELLQSMDKKLQDKFDILNALGNTQVNNGMIQRMNELLVTQRQAKEDQIKIWKFIQENTI
jgi:hypothetical protein